MPTMVTVQLSDEMIKELDGFMKVHDIDRSTAIRKLLEQSLNQWRIERAVSEGEPIVDEGFGGRWVIDLGIC